MSDSAALIAKLEAATEPTRELMCDAFAICYPDTPLPERGASHTETAAWNHWLDRRFRFGHLINAQAWTDAALMLVPPGYSWALIKEHAHGETCTHRATLYAPTSWRATAQERHPHHIALAIAIAALRARAA
jgi:hypothetical protein